MKEKNPRSEGGNRVEQYVRSQRKAFWRLYFRMNKQQSQRWKDLEDCTLHTGLDKDGTGELYLFLFSMELTKHQVYLGHLHTILVYLGHLHKSWFT